MSQQLSQPLEILLMNDQPFTCPHCGARCEEIVQEGDVEDATRKLEYYDETFEYLKAIGIRILLE